MSTTTEGLAVPDPGEPCASQVAELRVGEEPRPTEGAATAASGLDARRLIASTVLVLAALFAAVVVAGTYFREPLFAAAERFVEVLGGPGIALGFFLPDAFTIPLPNDVSSLLGLAGGLSFLEVCVWATLGSLGGGSLGYWIGRSLRRTRWARRVFESKGSRAQHLLDRYGLWAVAVAAITPLPYSIFCWAAGAGRVSFTRFLLVSQLRIVRVAGYLYLIELGLLGGLLPTG